MKQLFPLLFLLPLAACGDETVAANAAVPELNVMAETPGDWSDLRGMVGRAPAESGLFERSPITVDLNALLGEDAAAYRLAMGNASPLRREGPLLVTLSPTRQAYLVLLPGDHALEAGLRKGNGWRVVRTPGAEVPRTAEIDRLLSS